MQAKITLETGFKCAPDGCTVKSYPLGAIIDGKAAMMAIRAGAGEAYDPREDVKVVHKVETKTRKPRRKKVVE